MSHFDKHDGREFWGDIGEEEPRRPAVAPGKRTVTSGMSAPPQIILRVVDASVARALGEAIGQRDADGVAQDAESAVARASGSSGSPLPENVKMQFESSTGADLSSVRVHTGPESAEAAASIGARAYTTGSDIHFAEGEYGTDPFAIHLLAHEVAHTVQQSGQTGGCQTKLEVSSPGDRLEAEADTAADAMVSGRAASITHGASGQLHRSLGEDGEELYTSDDGKLRGDTSSYKPGEQGYSNALVAEADFRVGVSPQKDRLSPVQLGEMKGLNKMIDAQAQKIADIQTARERSPNHGKHLFDQSKAREQGVLTMLYGQRTAIQQMCFGYNQWINFPNTAMASLDRVVQMASILGASDAASLVGAVTSACAEARAIILSAREKMKNPNHNQTAYAEFEAAKNAVASDENQTVGSSVEGLESAYSACTNHYKNFQSLCMEVEQATVDENLTGEDGEKIDAKELTRRKQVIADNKASIRQIAGAVDTGLSIMGKAPLKVSTVYGQVQGGADAVKNANALKSAMSDAARGPQADPAADLLNEIMQNGTPEAKKAVGDAVKKAHVDIDPNKGMPGANGAETGLDEVQGNVGKMFGDIQKAGSVAGLAELITDAYYKSELDKINNQLNKVGACVDALKGVGASLKKDFQITGFTQALTDFGVALAKAINQMKAQQTKYKRFGAALDALARQNRDAKKADGSTVNVPAGQKEKFALVFTVGGAIREVVTMAGGGDTLEGTTTGNDGAYRGASDGGKGVGFTGKAAKSMTDRAGASRQHAANSSDHVSAGELKGGTTQMEQQVAAHIAQGHELWSAKQQEIGQLSGADAAIQALLAEFSGGKGGY